MQDENIIFFLFASSVALVTIVTGFILFVSLFFRAKRKALQERQEVQLNFQKELNRAKSEIQTETLNNIGRELHDNIGQLLAVTKIHADNVVTSSSSETTNEMSNILGQTIDEVRLLSRSLNADRFEKLGFEKAFLLEVERINKLKGMTFQYKLLGNKSFELGENRGVMLFRILQEFISNTLKYSLGNQIDFTIEYLPDEMKINGNDNGIGFDIENNSSLSGSGILNMKNRAKMINGTLTLTSEKEVGTRIEITIPKEITYDI